MILPFLIEFGCFEYEFRKTIGNINNMLYVDMLFSLAHMSRNTWNGGGGRLQHIFIKNDFFKIF